MSDETQQPVENPNPPSGDAALNAEKTLPEKFASAKTTYNTLEETIDGLIENPEIEENSKEKLKDLKIQLAELMAIAEKILDKMSLREALTIYNSIGERISTLTENFKAINTDLRENHKPEFAQFNERTLSLLGDAENCLDPIDETIQIKVTVPFKTISFTVDVSKKKEIKDQLVEFKKALTGGEDEDLCKLLDASSHEAARNTLALIRKRLIETSSLDINQLLEKSHQIFSGFFGEINQTIDANKSEVDLNKGYSEMTEERNQIEKQISALSEENAQLKFELAKLDLKFDSLSSLVSRAQKKLAELEQKLGKINYYKALSQDSSIIGWAKWGISYLSPSTYNLPADTEIIKEKTKIESFITQREKSLKRLENELLLKENEISGKNHQATVLSAKMEKIDLELCKHDAYALYANFTSALTIETSKKKLINNLDGFLRRWNKNIFSRIIFRQSRLCLQSLKKDIENFELNISLPEIDDKADIFRQSIVKYNTDLRELIKKNLTGNNDAGFWKQPRAAGKIFANHTPHQATESTQPTRTILSVA